MRRSASRKTGQSNSTDSADPFLSASGKASSKEMERIDNLFYTYANRSSGVIDPEGIEALCSDLEVNHTDVRVLMLAWKMKAEKQGYFTLEEWRRGLKSLRADNVNKLKKSLPELEKEVKRPSNFMDFYAYSFRYCLTEKQKSVDIESVCELLDLVLGSQCRAQVDYFIEYLKVQTDYKVINMDQWMGFFRFCNEIFCWSKYYKHWDPTFWRDLYKDMELVGIVSPHDFLSYSVEVWIRVALKPLLLSLLLVLKNIL
ncbi:DCN1-like protein 5 isoform X2 [Mangifera indica]|uniref:DCN1-like protein 5 isoform X2 n=1 Tax=Mangifera indica TaxID=29780 RepID=UPI001CF98963|nr:DCN1-like protein 5 isoform X2 [Mangifera indica]